MNLPLSYTACTYDNNKSCRNIYSLVMQMGNELCLSYPSLHSSAKQEILVGGQSWKLSLVWITGIWRACEKFFRTGFASFSSLIPGRTNFLTVFSCDFSQKSFKMGFSWRTPFFQAWKANICLGSVAVSHGARCLKFILRRTSSLWKLMLLLCMLHPSAQAAYELRVLVSRAVNQAAFTRPKLTWKNQKKNIPNFSKQIICSVKANNFKFRH